MTNVLHVAIIGGSETAQKLITDFLSRPFISIVGVADIDENSPGALTAARAGIPFTTDLAEVGDLEPTPDLVIDVCGEPCVDSTMQAAFAPGTPDGPAVVDNVVAQLVLNLAADSQVAGPRVDTTLPLAFQM